MQLQVVWRVSVDCVFDGMTHAECINIVFHIRVMLEIDCKLFITLNIQALIDSHSHPMRFQSIPLNWIRDLICLRSLFSVRIFFINRDPSVMFAQQTVRILNNFYILVFTHLSWRRNHSFIAIGLAVLIRFLVLPKCFTSGLWDIDEKLIWHRKFSFVTV